MINFYNANSLDEVRNVQPTPSIRMQSTTAIFAASEQDRSPKLRKRKPADCSWQYSRIAATNFVVLVGEAHNFSPGFRWCQSRRADCGNAIISFVAYLPASLSESRKGWYKPAPVFIGCFCFRNSLFVTIERNRCLRPMT